MTGTLRAASGMGFRSVLIRVAAMIAVALTVCSCRSRAEFRSPYDRADMEAGVYTVTTPAGLQRALVERAEPMETLWCRMGVTIRQDGRRRWPSFTAVAIYREPDFIKLGVSRTEIGTVMTLLIQGDDVSLYANRERRRFDGSLDDLAEKTAVLGGLAPSELITALTVQHEVARVLMSGERVAIREKRNHFLVAWRHPVSQRQYFWLLRKQDGLVEEVLVRTRAGAEELRIRYAGYRLEKSPLTQRELPYPDRMTFDLARGGYTLEVNAREYRLGLDLPASIVDLPPARETYPLSSLVLEDEP